MSVTQKITIYLIRHGESINNTLLHDEVGEQKIYPTRKKKK